MTVTKKTVTKNETSRDPLSHLCTHAHKCACVHTHTHTHTHAHILIHITHTRQPLYSVRPLYLPVQILGVTDPMIYYVQTGMAMDLPYNFYLIREAHTIL